jgi:hypothetical protein
MNITSVGWCAGRPADHGYGDEQDVASKFLREYLDTTAVRDFRGTNLPAANWWDTQTCGAVSEAYAAGRVAHGSVDVVFSWEKVWAGTYAGLAALLDARPGWVRRTILLGRHESDKKATASQHLADNRRLREQVNAYLDFGPGERPADPHATGAVLMGPAYILYRARIGNPGAMAGYIEPSVEEQLLDFIAWDVYPSDPTDKPNSSGVGTRYEDPASVFSLPAQWMTRTGLPTAIAELHHGRVPGDSLTGAPAELAGYECADWHEGIYREAVALDALFVTQFAYNLGDFLAHDRYPEAVRWRSVTREAATAARQYSNGWLTGHVAGQGEAHESAEKARSAAFREVAAWATRRAEGPA